MRTLLVLLLLDVRHHPEVSYAGGHRDQLSHHALQDIPVDNIMPAMNRCPLEVWAYIFQLACTDGGQAGCSLSRVSHTVHDLAQPSRYYSVSLTSAESFVQFATLLVDTLEQTPVIRHMFVDTPSRLRPRSIHYSMNPRDSAYVLHFWDHLLPVIAPNLFTLFIHDVDITPFPRPSVHFPLLRTLSLSRLGPLPDPRSITQHLPALERLHLTQSYDHPRRPRQTADIQRYLPRFLPSITHLRLSALEDTNTTQVMRMIAACMPDCAHLQFCIQSTLSDFPRAAAVAAGSGFVTANAPPSDPALPSLPHLRYVCLQPQFYDILWKGTVWKLRDAQRSYEARAMRHEEDCLDTGSEHARLQIVPGETYSLEMAMEDWLDVVSGGDGPWKTG